jgi:hypothetical protein
VSWTSRRRLIRERSLCAIVLNTGNLAEFGYRPSSADQTRGPAPKAFAGRRPSRRGR